VYFIVVIGAPLYRAFCRYSRTK